MYEVLRVCKVNIFFKIVQESLCFVLFIYTNVQFICCVTSVLRWLKTVADCKVETSIRETASCK